MHYLFAGICDDPGCDDDEKKMYAELSEKSLEAMREGARGISMEDRIDIMNSLEMGIKEAYDCVESTIELVAGE